MVYDDAQKMVKQVEKQMLLQEEGEIDAEKIEETDNHSVLFK